MSLLLAGLLAAGTGGAALVGRWLAKRREPGPGGASGEEKRDETRDGMPGANATAAVKETEGLEGFPCQLGDVVMRLTGEEAWLAGGLVLSEERPVAVIFVAPEAGHDRVLFAKPEPRPALYWLEPLDAKEILVGGEPPSSVEHRGIRFERARRLPLRPRRLGVGAPDVGEAVVVAEYTSAGAERLVVLKGSAGSHAYRGIELDRSAYEVIASGRATLDG